MSLRTPKLDLPYIAPSQAQKHITHNEAIRALDALVQLSVSAVSDSPTETPADGQRYIVSDNPMGVFEGHAQKVASFQDGAWRFLTLKWVGRLMTRCRTVCLFSQIKAGIRK